MTFSADQCCSLDFNDTNGFYGSGTNPVLSEQDESPLGEFYPWKVFCHKSGECQQGAYKTIRQQPKTTPGTGWISCQLRVYEFLAPTFLVFFWEHSYISVGWGFVSNFHKDIGNCLFILYIHDIVFIENLFWDSLYIQSVCLSVFDARNKTSSLTSTFHLLKGSGVFFSSGGASLRKVVSEIVIEQ